MKTARYTITTRRNGTPQDICGKDIEMTEEIKNNNIDVLRISEIKKGGEGKFIRISRKK